LRFRGFHTRTSVSGVSQTITIAAAATVNQQVIIIIKLDITCEVNRTISHSFNNSEKGLKQYHMGGFNGDIRSRAKCYSMPMSAALSGNGASLTLFVRHNDCLIT
jgi:hypothetical protein